MKVRIPILAVCASTPVLVQRDVVQENERRIRVRKMAVAYSLFFLALSVGLTIASPPAIAGAYEDAKRTSEWNLKAAGVMKRQGKEINEFAKKYSDYERRIESDSKKYCEFLRNVSIPFMEGQLRYYSVALAEGLRSDPIVFAVYRIKVRSLKTRKRVTESVCLGLNTF